MAQSPYASAILLTVTALLYFRATFTSDRNYNLSNDGPSTVVTAEELQRVKELGPVKLYDVRVILSAFIVAVPGWLALLPVRDPSMSETLLLFSLGAFLAPLTFPLMPLHVKELGRPMLFVTKYFAGRFDGWLKELTLVAACYVLLRVPGISIAGSTVAEWMFPAIKHQPSSAFFQELVGASVAAMMIMYLVRAALISVHGFSFVVLLCASTAWIWLSLQFYANEVFSPLAPTATVGLGIWLARMMISVANDLLGMLVEALE
jgi:hypothetical protein